MGMMAMVNTSNVGSLVEFTFSVSHVHHSGYIRHPRLFWVYNQCPTPPHTLSGLCPVFEANAFLLHKFNIVWMCQTWFVVEE